MELKNIFCNIPLVCSILPSDSEEKSRFKTNYKMSCTAGEQNSCYSDNSLVVSNYMTLTTPSGSVTSSYDVESITPLVSCDPTTPTFSGESVTSSSFSGESVKSSSFSGESVKSSSFSGESVKSSCYGEFVTPCEWMVSPSSSLSEDLLSQTEFNEIFSYISPSDDSFTDVISCDDVFDPPELSKMDMFSDHVTQKTYTTRNVCQNIVRPSQILPGDQNRRTYTPRNSSMSNCGSTKPRRKRTQSIRQRSAANVRERNRMVYLNKAFNVLRNKLPGFNKKLSRIETLRTAISYIKCMEKITS